ncbi:2-oxo acid dehydrogenase subunit E2 [Zavarzinella formosa]|uniref:2-oxo acid dehydrogenase subunit E2 n=1 Tax=Zavarzinella formosa TaxID=360055 RepID=UPI0002FECB8A|nr:2-oxo acid dehydrogenase subunit E2 [Zavarzinella formosa]
MAEDPRGKYLRVTPGRVLINEIMRHSRDVPLIVVERQFRLPEVMAARRLVEPNTSWVALFAKAYGVAGLRIPNLRWCWVRLPWGRIYEHPYSECAVIVEREYEGEMCVLTSSIRSPEDTSLADITNHIRRFRDDPVLSVSGFLLLIRLVRLPGFMRWLMLWWYLSWTGRKRSKRFGTFTISSLGNYGVDLITPIMPLSAYLTFGPISEDGTVTVRLIFDHRVMDGRHAAKTLVEMETIMNGQLATEMREAAKSKAEKELENRNMATAEFRKI